MDGKPARRRIALRLAALLLGTAAAVLLLAVAGVAWRWWRPPARHIQLADHAALRAKLDHNPAAIYVFDETLSFRLKPHFCGARLNSQRALRVTNSRGLVGAEEIDPRTGVRKVLLLGDSVLYGQEVPTPQTYASLVVSQAPPDVQLLNASCPGWSTHQELAYVRKFLADVPLDTVVLCVCLNDLVRFEWVYKNDREFEMSPDIGEVGGFWVTNESAAGARLWTVRRRYELLPGMQPIAALHNGFLCAWDSGRWEPFRGEVLSGLLELPHRPRVVVAVTPVAAQLEALAAGAVAEEVFFPQRQLATFCREQRIAFWDAFDALKVVNSSEAVFQDTCHLSPHGHAAVAADWGPRLGRLLATPSPAGGTARTAAGEPPGAASRR